MTGPANLRDLGGLPLVGGGTTRSGVLLRSDAPYADDAAGFLRPPATVVDLRSSREVAAHPYDWGPATRVHRHELYDAGDLSQVPADGGLLAVYEGILDSAAERIAAVPGLLDATGPTLVHCAAGKDRTGVVVAALLLAAGVDPTAVAADYRRTEESMAGVLERLHAHGALAPGVLRPEWAQAPAEAVALVVDRLTGWPGGPRQWLVDHGTDPIALDAFVSRLAGRR